MMLNFAAFLDGQNFENAINFDFVRSQIAQNCFWLPMANKNTDLNFLEKNAYLVE